MEKYLNRIITGNCLTRLQNKENFPDNKIDLIITSPPYADKRAKTYQTVKSSEYVEWFLPIAQEFKRILKPRGSFILNIKENVKDFERNTYTYELLLALKEQGWLWVEEYCWSKSTSFPGYWPNRFRDGWERVYHFTKEKDIKFYRDAVKVPIGEWAKKRFNGHEIASDNKRHLSNTGSGLARKVKNWKGKKKVFPDNILKQEVDPDNVLKIAPVPNNLEHSAAYPVELPSWFIKLLTRKGNIVLDPFMGSGTTAIAALRLKRKFIGIDIKSDFNKEAKKRIEKEIKKLEKKSKK